MSKTMSMTRYSRPWGYQKGTCTLLHMDGLLIENPVHFYSDISWKLSSLYAEAVSLSMQPAIKKHILEI